MKRCDASGVRLHRLDLAAIEPAKAANAVGATAAFELPQARELRDLRSDDQLAAAIVGDTPLLAVAIELGRALQAQPRLQRPRGVVDAGVQHARVVQALVGAEPSLALQHADRGPRFAAGHLTRDCEPDDPTADDREVAPLGG